MIPHIHLVTSGNMWCETQEELKATYRQVALSDWSSETTALVEAHLCVSVYFGAWHVVPLALNSAAAFEPIQTVGGEHTQPVPC